MSIKADIILVRGAAIAGTVVDEFGEPFVGARVTPFRLRYVRGRRQLVPGGSSALMTDDLGQFRLFGLAPGDFTVAASTPVLVADHDAGEIGYARTFAPGTPNVSETQPISLSPGQSATHVEITLSPTRVARLEGVLTDVEGQPISYGVVQVTDRSTNTDVAIGQVNSNGGFTVSGVPPGEYFLKSNSSKPGPDGMAQVARLPVVVRGQDLSGLRLASLSSVIINGRIDIDPLAASDLRLDGVKAEVVRLGDDGLSELRPTPVAVNPDRSFQLQSIVGTVKVVLSGLPAGWSIRSVKAGETYVTDGLDLEPAMMPDAFSVQITDRFPRLKGKVVDARGNVVEDYNVVVFSKNAELWGWNSRHLLLGSPSARNSEFEVGPLPPGDYYVVAVPQFQDDQWANVDYLEAISRRAQAVTMLEGELRSITLTLQAAR